MPQEYQLFAGKSHLDFARRVAEKLERPLVEPEETNRKGAKMVHWFSNENVLVTIPRNVRGQWAFVFQTQASPVSDNIMELIHVIWGLKQAGAARVIAVCPYLPYSRSDKEDQPRRVIGLKVMAAMLETAGVDGLVTMDSHPAEIKAYFPRDIRVDVLRAKPLFARHILSQLNGDKAVAVAPDFGEAKHIGGIANLLGIDTAIIDKRRTGDDERAKPADIKGDVDGKHCLVFDDEVASGGTIIETAEFCKARGARSVVAHITHPVLTQVDRLKACDALDQLVVTDTIPVPAAKRYDRLKVLSVAMVFAGAIERLAAGTDSLDSYKQQLYRGLKGYRGED